MKRICSYLLTGLVAASGFAQDAGRPLYFKATHITTFEDWRAYSGGKTFAWGFELGYDFSKPGDLASLSAYAGMVRSLGDVRREIYQNPSGSNAPLDTAFNLTGWRTGVDVRFETPWKGVTPYLGLNLNWWRGDRVSDSPVLGPKGPFQDAETKFGVRAGVEYQINPAWAVSVEYNLSEWRSNAKDTNPNGSKEANLKIAGYNPMSPTWMALSVHYRWNW